MVTPLTTGQTQPRERRYIAEYMAQAFPNGNYQLNVPLGQIPSDIRSVYGLTGGAALVRPSRPRIDAVAWDKNWYWLIEAKIREAKAALGDIITYFNLAPQTDDLPNFNKQAFRKTIVVPWALDWILTAANAQDIHVEIYLPPWVEQYVKDRQNYFTKDYKVARDEKMRLRKTLGVE